MKNQNEYMPVFDRILGVMMNNNVHFDMSDPDAYVTTKYTQRGEISRQNKMAMKKLGIDIVDALKMKCIKDVCMQAMFDEMRHMRTVCLDLDAADFNNFTCPDKMTHIITEVLFDKNLAKIYPEKNVIVSSGVSANLLPGSNFIRNDRCADDLSDLPNIMYPIGAMGLNSEYTFINSSYDSWASPVMYLFDTLERNYTYSIKKTAVDKDTTRIDVTLYITKRK